MPGPADLTDAAKVQLLEAAFDENRLDRTKKEPRMATSRKTARHKLNRAHFLGVLLIAGLVGAIFESWMAFLIATGVLIVSSVHDGHIRP